MADIIASASNIDIEIEPLSEVQLTYLRLKDPREPYVLDKQQSFNFIVCIQTYRHVKYSVTVVKYPCGSLIVMCIQPPDGVITSYNISRVTTTEKIALLNAIKASGRYVRAKDCEIFGGTAND